MGNFSVWKDWMATLVFHETITFLAMVFAVFVLCVDVLLDFNAMSKFTHTPNGNGYAMANAAAIFVVCPIVGYVMSLSELARHEDLPGRGLMLLLGVLQVAPLYILFLTFKLLLDKPATLFDADTGKAKTTWDQA